MPRATVGVAKAAVVKTAVVKTAHPTGSVGETAVVKTAIHKPLWSKRRGQNGRPWALRVKQP